jgi:threonylcarbamoyladenosine tRNA methylthiotransferase MtaB
MTGEKKKVAFHTLGCKLNFAESSTIAASSKADIYIINTCSVTDAADRKCRQAIRKFISRSPGAFIAVVGCYAQLNPGEISSIPGVDLVLGTNEKFNIADYISDVSKKKNAEVHSCDVSSDGSFHPSFSMGDRTRSFLKVQDGCDYGCSYCTIPMARGGSRNPSIGTLTGEAKAIASRGIKEIVLTGVNIGDFGRSTGESFSDLLRSLINVEGIERIRISSIEPNLLTDDIIDIAAGEGKILPHFHIPLQSGSDKILGLMRRRYRRSLFAERIARISDKIPLAGIGADVIVGFPGETDSDFSDTYSFLSDQPLSYLHVFSYSERPGTAALSIPEKIENRTREERSRLLAGLSVNKHNDFLILNTGKPSRVLFEHSRSGSSITGFSSNYIRTEAPWNPKLAGEVKNVILSGILPAGRMSVEIIN